jgi:EAL domain-containing protein (putative c-di-GMP-specific phosphodiesterase class I)
MVVTPSIGISVYPYHGKEARALIVSADAAMYNAKKAGRNNFQFYSKETANFFPRRLELENDLRRALTRNEFELHYQPRVNIDTGETVGMEALLRWRHPRNGLVAPADFIPLAEETGLIIPIGTWAMEEACRQNKAWQDKGLPRVRVAVNISALQFRQRNLLECVAGALERSGLAPHYLEVEITESVVMQKASEAIVTLEQLARMGVNISIDDFGTGYSSLSYLRRFPLHTLKIDRSFIRDISEDSDDAAIVSAIIAIAHSLGLEVVAEGVETAEQLSFLRSLGCDAAQGYYFSKPLPPEEFAQLLADWNPRARAAVA